MEKSQDSFTERSEPPAYTPLPPSQITTSTIITNNNDHHPQLDDNNNNNDNNNNTSKIVAIPALHSSFNSPFLRCYPPTLLQSHHHHHQLPRDTFLTFLDKLNKAISTSPAPLEVLDICGGILRSAVVVPPILFPLHWLGSAVSGLAKLGSVGVSKSRTDSVLRQANREIFNPRGLKVELCRLDALAYLAGIPVLDSRGKINRNSAIVQKLLASDDGDDDDDDGDDEGEEEGKWQNIDAVQRRIRVLKPWIAELEIDVLPWTAQSRLTRFNAVLKKRNDGIQQQQQNQQYQQYQHQQQEYQHKQSLSAEEYANTMTELDRRERELREKESREKEPRENHEPGDDESTARALAEIAEERSLVRDMFAQGTAQSQRNISAQGGGQEDDDDVKKGLWLVIREV